MTICVETVQKYGLDDYRTPVFVFERLSSIVYPEANDIGEFFLALEKDPQQEDFLQGSLWGWKVMCDYLQGPGYRVIRIQGSLATLTHPNP